MGQQVTKYIRSRLEHCTLEELLIDDKCIEELQRHLPALPKRSHTNLAKILASLENALSKDSSSGSQPNAPPKGGNSSPKDRNPGTSRLSSLWLIQSKDISIPKSVAEALKQEHCNILRQSSKNAVDLQSPVDHYEYTCAVETGRTLDRILWRFLTTFYYDLISEFDATKRQFSTIANGGVAFMVAVICQSGKHNPETVREKVVGWTKVGRRYRGFMDSLCAGCLILFPDHISDLVWEKYVPMKGDVFAKVIEFLQGLGMVDKCEKEGWNDLGNKILQTLREPFRCLIAFQIQPGQQSQIGGVANSSLTPVASDADIPSRTLDSRALPRPVANRVVKAKRKKGTTSVRRQLQSFARDLTAHQTSLPQKSLPLVFHQSHHASRAHRSESQHESHGRDPQSRCPRAPTQCWASAPNYPRQWHLATNHQDDRLLSSSVSINDRGRDPLSNISLNAPNVYPSGTDSVQYMQDVAPGSHQPFVSPPGSQVHGHCHVDQGQRTRESISNTLSLERIGISTISAVLNHDQSTAVVTTQGSLQGECTEPVSDFADQATTDVPIELDLDSGTDPQKSDVAPAGVVTHSPRVQCDKDTLCRIVRERPTDISGSIWFGCPPGYRPFVSLRLPKSLGKTVKLPSQKVHQPEPSPDAGSTFTALYSIKLGDLCQLIQRDGFGTIFWNHSREGDDAIVSVEVVDEELIAEFIQVGIVMNGLQ
ncbi:hypothetical protein BKA61DRAFT_621262 [Leptodontidium sp. MPI-SDFR-AT-0119]|nr:hypothetical protein BKA61DRAFT_621262 [Leptodontidium sp. MPI-SDFR-AT-0119]